MHQCMYNYSEVTGYSLTRIEFLLQLIKEMCGDPSTKSNLSFFPTMVLKSSSQTLRKKKQLNYNYVKISLASATINACCGRHTTFTFIVATCSSCKVERS